MVVHKTVFNTRGKVDRLLSLANSSFYLGIGKPTPWTTFWGDDISDLNPPNPNPDIVTIPELVFYKSPIYKTLALDSQCGNVEFTQCGESLDESKKVTLIDLEKTSLDNLYVLSPKYLYIRVEIAEEDLTYANITSFRTLGLFKDPLFNNLNNIRYLASDLATPGKIYWTDYFSPISKNTLVNKKSIFEILLTI